MTLLCIAAGSSALTSIGWTVKSSTTQICVNVDPGYLIPEVTDGNNNACRDVSRVLDSDNDGLTDYEERNGMRVAFPNALVKTNPFDEDSDNDGLWDGEEMGKVVYDYWNKVYYDSFASVYGWNKALYDGYHYEYKSDPTQTDRDGDGLNDKQEFELGLNPFVYESYNLVEAGYGFLCGDFCFSDPRHGNLAYLGGWLASGYLVFGDIRDLPSTVLRGDAFDFTFTIIGLAPVIGDSESTVTKFVKFAKKFPDKILDIAKTIIKTIPSESLRISALDGIYDGAASALKGKGISEGLNGLIENGVHLSELNKWLYGLQNVKGYQKLLGRVNSGALGPAYEAKVAATKGADNIAEISRDITTSAGSTELDVLLKDGSIIEAKSGDLSKVIRQDEQYNNLATQIAKFKAYHSENNIQASIEIVFRIEPSQDIKNLLLEKNIGWRILS